MRLTDIPTMAVRPHMPPRVRHLQKEAPQYLAALIEKGKVFKKVRSLDDMPPDSIDLLEGGNTSVLYCLRFESSIAVIKLRTDGVEAEREALEAWAACGVRVPTIRQTGVLPAITGKGNIKYLQLDFVIDKKGEGAPTVTAYLKKNPTRGRRMGQALGRTLARMHTARTSRKFGEFSDTPGQEARYGSWNRYLLGYIRMHRSYLIGLGISTRLIKEFERMLLAEPFSSEGTYLHGDYSPRNVMLASIKPIRIVVFDPNPLVGDPSWDISVLFSNHEYARKRFEEDPAPEHRRDYRYAQRFFEGFWTSYQKASKRKVPLQAIRISQLIQAIIHLQTEERKRYRKKSEKELEMNIRRETLFERFGALRLT